MIFFRYVLFSNLKFYRVSSIPRGIAKNDGISIFIANEVSLAEFNRKITTKWKIEFLRAGF